MLQIFLSWLLEDLYKQDEVGRLFVEMHAEESYLADRSFLPQKTVNPIVLKDAELRDIKVPTLYLVGEHEKIYSPEKAMERLNEAAAQIKAEIIPGAGHDLTMVQSNVVNEKILTFLAVLSSNGKSMFTTSARLAPC